MNNNNIFIKLISISIIFSYLVIIIGAYTRLTDAGLGCPDWPGCYGKLIAQHRDSKAWTEMIHRYLAGTLGLLIILISFYTIYTNYKKNITIKNNTINNKICSYILPCLLILCLIFQALLGMWTVTLKLLPTVVMGHLIGGFTIISLLLLLLLSNFNFSDDTNFSKYTKYISLFSLIIISCQILLGGWTSSNYAAIPCLDFPSCNGQYWPLDNTILHALNPFKQIGPNYEGGLLAYPYRVTIQIIHRYGALLSSIFILLIYFNLKKYNLNYYKKFANWLLFLLTTQITLGIINVKWALPLFSAIMHNGVGCLILLTLVTLNYKIYK